MKVPVWTELVCASCKQASPGCTTSTGHIDVDYLTSAARDAGWLFKHDKCFCSQPCVDDFEAKQAAQKA
ncbi:hypothetical protein AB4Y45_33010 [Paraburkholderia sp. EG287A]|uniref:hypothetical protein n=1 Tax=Paraburkholderia sp. EG287A TaxID=3237012 RepID=UPI0034D38AD3